MSNHSKYARYQPGKWCIVDRIHGGSVVTKCYGRWPSDHLYETADAVFANDICGGCAMNAEKHDVVEIRLPDLPDAEAIAYSRTRTRHPDDGLKTVLRPTPFELLAQAQNPFADDEPTKEYSPLTLRFDMSDVDTSWESEWEP